MEHAVLELTASPRVHTVKRRGFHSHQIDRGSPGKDYDSERLTETRSGRRRIIATYGGNRARSRQSSRAL